MLETGPLWDGQGGASPSMSQKGSAHKNEPPTQAGGSLIKNFTSAVQASWCSLRLERLVAAPFQTLERNEFVPDRSVMLH